MAKLLNIDEAISAITGRSESMFNDDILSHQDALLKEIENSSILVIGGAGTIGSNFIKAILSIGKPSKLIVVDINENALTELVRDLRSSTTYNLPDDLRTYPINFSDNVFQKLFNQEGVFDIVANFAAHKHVRSEKDIYSIEAMLDNNIIKANKFLNLLLAKPPKHFFCVSTDKAANPVNIMGASKKLMEDVIMTYSEKIKITTARFANVAFSNGSLPAGFLERLNKRQPIACPPDVKRFFVSPFESGQICMMACLLGNSGEIFFPKLDGEKDMKSFEIIIYNLMKQLGFELDICSSDEEARLKSLSLNASSRSYPVYFSPSDTSGEKSYEEFYTEDEKIDMNTFSSLGIIKEKKKKPLEEIRNLFVDLDLLFSKSNITKSAIVTLLEKYIENFQHVETGKGLDNKM